MTAQFLTVLVFIAVFLVSLVLGIRAGKKKYEELGRIADERLGRNWRSRAEPNRPHNANSDSEPDPKSDDNAPGSE